jgi:lysophospholipase L1-like esterase
MAQMRFLIPLIILQSLALHFGASATGTFAQDLARERKDDNSRVAHQQLLEKAKKGRIDVYFVGDSITRRWGATDYPKFLEHWNQCFKGWNPANFGWGGDAAENVLWRLQNGELDGVNPKVIILQVGANNLARPPISDAAKDRLNRVVAAILEMCHSKAPKASVYLFGVFPRGDNALSTEELKDINMRLGKMAVEKSAKFVDLTDKLIDSDGKLKKGVTVDGLHLSLDGYQIWAEAIIPILKRELGSKNKEDLAPPPTGDPKAARAKPVM